MTTWIYDDNGNKASIDYFGSKNKAQAALDSLANCTFCVNCKDCKDCNDCDGCDDCEGCDDCFDCTNCSFCEHCVDLDGYSWWCIMKPMTDSISYQKEEG